MSFSDTLQDVLQFLRSPRLPEEPPQSPPLTLFIHILGLSLLLSFGMLMLLGLLQQSGLIPELPHAMEDVMEDYPLWMVFLLAALAAPLMEELAFRLWLIGNPLYVIISLWVMATFMNGALIQTRLPVLGYVLLGIAAMLTVLMLTFKEATAAVLDRIYGQHYSWVFYGASILFALLHLINFKPDLQILLMAPLLVLPQFLLGLLLGYLRVQLGLVWAIALHGVYNGLILLLAFGGMQMESPATTGWLLFF